MRKIFFIRNKKNTGLNRGMTYIEMIVVLGIFSVLSTVAVFNYNGFQDRVDLSNLGSDIALKIMQAQNDSRSGTWTALASEGWKPSYGLYFEADSTNDRDFIYFADYDNDGILDNAGGMDCSGECLQKITLTKGNRISDLLITAGGLEDSVSDATVVFSRLNAEPIVSDGGVIVQSADLKITAESPKGLQTFITVAASGRLEVD